jgi:hypothetical protein
MKQALIAVSTFLAAGASFATEGGGSIYFVLKAVFPF